MGFPRPGGSRKPMSLTLEEVVMTLAGHPAEENPVLGPHFRKGGLGGVPLGGSRGDNHSPRPGGSRKPMSLSLEGPFLTLARHPAEENL